MPQCDPRYLRWAASWPAAAAPAVSQRPPEQRQGVTLGKPAIVWQEQEKLQYQFGYNGTVAGWVKTKMWYPQWHPSLSPGQGRTPGARAALVPRQCQRRCLQPQYLPPYGELKSSGSSISAPWTSGQCPARDGSPVNRWDPTGVQQEEGGPVCACSPAFPTPVGLPAGP